jgi:hypothetical protein
MVIGDKSVMVPTLRTEYGLPIETLHETHGGPFEGIHGRYVLCASVRYDLRAMVRPKEGKA